MDSLLFKEQRKELLFGYCPVAIIVYFIKDIFYILVCLFRAIEEGLNFLNRYEPTMVRVKVIEGILETLSLQDLFLVTGGHEELCKVNQAWFVGIDELQNLFNLFLAKTALGVLWKYL